MNTPSTHSQAPPRPVVPTWARFFYEHLQQVPVIAILRGLGPDDAVERAQAAWAAGVRLVEVTLERPEAGESLQAVVTAAPADTPVGAGTVTTPDRLALALELGAQFAIAPGLDEETVEAAKTHGAPFLPGVATPTEAGHAQRLGVTTVKAFPAAALGPGWVTAMRDPFPELRVIATGGITTDNAPDFLRAGALGIGLGSSLQKTGPREVVAAIRR